MIKECFKILNLIRSVNVMLKDDEFYGVEMLLEGRENREKIVVLDELIKDIGSDVMEIKRRYERMKSIKGIEDREVMSLIFIVLSLKEEMKSIRVRLEIKEEE
jgi:hypothetical protein